MSFNLDKNNEDSPKLKELKQKLAFYLADQQPEDEPAIARTRKAIRELEARHVAQKRHERQRRD